MEKTEKTKLQWHPAFCAAMHLVLRKDKDKLKFHEEYTLGTKPLLIDLLIDVIEVTDPSGMQSIIGKTLKKYNIFEYKSPGDALGITEYHKVIAYANLFISQPGLGYKSKTQDVTITLVREEKPAKLMRYLIKENGCEILRDQPGIYTVKGHHQFPLRIIATGELTHEDLLWLNGMTKKLKMTTAHRMVHGFGQLDEEDQIYGDSVITLIMNANEIESEEAKTMIESLEKYFEPKFQQYKAEGIAMGRSEGIAMGRSEGIAEIKKSMQANGLPQELIEKIMKGLPN